MKIGKFRIKKAHQMYKHCNCTKSNQHNKMLFRKRKQLTSFSMCDA